MGFHRYHGMWCSLEFFLIVQSGGGSCKPDGQGKGPVVVGSMEVEKSIKLGQDLWFISVWKCKLS